MPFEKQKVAFIGSGVMGEAMIKGLLNRELLRPEQIVAADPREERGADATRASPFGEPLDPLERESGERAPTARRTPTTIDVYA